MDFIASYAEKFNGLFRLGGETFLGFVTTIVPTLIVLITFVNAIIKLIGEKRVEKVAAICSKNFILRYTLLPFVSLFVVCNPMAYAMGRFLEEKHKPAFYDAGVSFCHPITGLFPHANASEVFVFLGIAQGIQLQQLNVSALAVRYFVVGLIVILIRGLLTERLTLLFLKKERR